MTLSLEERIAGVLVPVFAIRSSGDLGIGDAVSLSAFVDWAASVGFKIVKMLPINETGGDHSPYNAISARALDPTIIRTTSEALPDLRREECEGALKTVPREKLESETVHYEVVKPLKQLLLEAAFNRFAKNHLSKKTGRGSQFLEFVRSQADWMEEYALFRALLEEHGGQRWDTWPEPDQTPAGARARVEALPSRKRQAFEKRMRFFQYVQWIAFSQWRETKRHAEEKGIALMGDIPFGVSFQSADVWAHPEYFLKGWCGGTPPDRIFKHDPFVQKWGQNWGIPLYDWPVHRADHFRWWRRRVHGVREFFDLFRIDHVLGFYRIYGFPWRPERNAEFLPLSEEEARARTGGEMPRFQPRPDDTDEHKARNCAEGEEYLRAVLDEAGAGSVIGEDLGEVPDYVRPNLRSLQIGGYKIPQWEKRHDGALIPGSDYERLSLATYATHDHDPLKTMWEQLARDAAKPDGDGARWERRILGQYAGLTPDNLPEKFTEEVHLALLRALFRSNSWIAVAMITDVFGRVERFNSPGVASDTNWTQRIHVPVEMLGGEPLSRKMRELLLETGRISSSGR